MGDALREQMIHATNLFFRSQTAREREQYAKALEQHKRRNPARKREIECLERAIRAVWAENPPTR